MAGSGRMRSSMPHSVAEERNPDDQAQWERQMAKQAWREKGVVLLRPDDLENDWLRRAIESLATEIYGPRRLTADSRPTKTASGKEKNGGEA